jgi:hypothetical protein
VDEIKALAGQKGGSYQLIVDSLLSWLHMENCMPI